MVRFLCFPARIHYHRLKKSIQQSDEAMHKSVEDSPQDQASNVSSNSSSPNPVLLIAHDSNLSSTSTEQITSSDSFECCRKSEEMNSSFNPEINSEVLQIAHLKKSQSLGSGLDREGRVACDADTEDEIDQGLSCSDSHEKNFNRMFDAFDHDGSAESFDHKDPEMKNFNRMFDAFDHDRLPESFDYKDPEMNLFNQYQEAVLDECFQTNADPVHNESIFSIGDLKQLEQERHGDFTTQVSGEHVGDSGNQNIPDAPHVIMKSSSLPNLRFCTTVLGEGLPSHGFIGHRSRSFEDLHSLDARRREFLTGDDGLCSQITLYRFGAASSCHNISQTSHLLGKEFLAQKVSGEDCALSNPSGGSYELADHEREHTFESENGKCENQFTDGYDSVSFTGLVKDWTLPEIYRADMGKVLQHESPVPRWDEFPCKEFHNQRIEEWISKIDLQNTGPVQELGECSCSSSSSTTKLKKSSNAMGGLATAKFDARITPGMEVANNYISSLTAMSSSAQMANLGLVLIPVLGAFVSLRVLNLSGNSIVRITAGALPRGLHILNLSKNIISTIEGLRELTRLRVLDLSYNRIFRIGHGLASCSSLKELYLAGNKIGEAEGLHRLLKLNVLDLRLNKISTAKSLGQLAANYSCLQSINLEGNPAQKNIGDEQLKKYLLGLLPHLLYFNKQSIRSSSSKDVNDRTSRSITSHQYDRSLRTEHKIPRKGTVVSHKPSSSSNHGRLGQAVSSPKRSKDRQRRLPPSGGSKGTTHHQQNIASNLLSLRSDLSIRRSRSEGTLGPS